MYGRSFRRATTAVLLLGLAAGAALRLGGLDRRSVSHPEMYVPGIHLADGVSEPAERTTLRRIVTGTFSSDTHPPGYYLLMFPWTRLAGTSLTAMRLPSALLGTACIPLVYVLGVLTVGEIAGAGAAVLLAFNGYHVFWSQVARMFALECFLGLAASVILLIIVRGPRPRPAAVFAYAVLMLLGLAAHIFFWTLLFTHMVWTFANSWGRGELPGIGRSQLAVAVLGCPLLAFAVYQSATTVALLSGNVWRYAWEYLPFAFALPSDESGSFPQRQTAPFTGAPVWWGARAALFLVALALLASAIKRLRELPSVATVKAGSPRRVFWEVLWSASATLGTWEILFFIRMTRRLPADYVHATLAATKRLVVLPTALACTAILVNRLWKRLPYPGRCLRALHGNGALVALLACLPVTLLGAASQVRPLLNQRGLMLFAPYLLLLLSTGFVAHPRGIRAAGLGAVVALACGASLYAYHGMTVDPADYAQFAASLRARIEPGDLVFVHRVWYATPILYYLPPGRYRLVGHDYARACRENPQARVWVVQLYDPAPTGEVRAALQGYRPVGMVTGDRARATLYDPNAESVPNL